MRCSKIGTIRGDKKYPPDLDIAPKGKTTYIRALREELRKVFAADGLAATRAAIREADAKMKDLHSRGAGAEPPRQETA